LSGCPMGAGVLGLTPGCFGSDESLLSGRPRERLPVGVPLFATWRMQAALWGVRAACVVRLTEK